MREYTTFAAAAALSSVCCVGEKAYCGNWEEVSYEGVLQALLSGVRPVYFGELELESRPLEPVQIRLARLEASDMDRGEDVAARSGEGVWMMLVARRRGEGARRDSMAKCNCEREDAMSSCSEVRRAALLEKRV